MPRLLRAMPNIPCNCLSYVQSSKSRHAYTGVDHHMSCRWWVFRTHYKATSDDSKSQNIFPRHREEAVRICDEQEMWFYGNLTFHRHSRVPGGTVLRPGNLQNFYSNAWCRCKIVYLRCSQLQLKVHTKVQSEWRVIAYQRSLKKDGASIVSHFARPLLE